jgi:tight adherence protein B
MARAKERRTLRNPLNTEMPNYAVYVFSGMENAAVRLVSFIIGGMAGQIFYGGLFKAADGSATAATQISNAVFFAAVGIAAVKFLVPLYGRRRLDKQKSGLRKQFLSLLDSLSASFASGSNVMKAFETAYTDLKTQYSERDFIVREAREILDGAAQNLSAELFLKDFGERSGNDNVINFAEVFETCYRRGGDMQSVIMRTNDSIREKIMIQDEIETKLTSNKMQLNVMSLMPIAIVAMLRLTNPSFAEAFATLTGVAANTIAIGIFVGAYKYGQKVVAIGG